MAASAQTTTQMLSRLKTFGLPIGVEKLAVVVDIGAAYTKCGFAGECAPRHVIPSQITRKGKVYRVFDPEVSTSPAETKEILIDFFFDIFYKYLLVKTNERRILIVENPLSPTVFRNALAEVLFGHYKMMSVFFAPLPPLALLPLGSRSGIVVDVGYTETNVVAVSNNTALMFTWKSVPLGGKAIQKRIKELLHVEGRAELPDDIVEDIMACESTPSRLTQQVRLCFGSKPPSHVAVASVDYPHAGTKLKVDAAVRLCPTSVLFDLDDEDQSVASIILDALVKAPRDTRRQLASNIAIIGGGAMLPGFAAQLLVELRALIATPRYAPLHGSGKEHVQLEFTASFADGSPGGSLPELDEASMRAHLAAKLGIDEATDFLKFTVRLEAKAAIVTVATRTVPKGLSSVQGTIVLGQHCSYLFESVKQSVGVDALGLAECFAVFTHPFPEHCIGWLGAMELLADRSISLEQYTTSPILSDWVQLPADADEPTPPASAGPVPSRAPQPQIGRPKEWGAGIVVGGEVPKLVP